MMEQDISIMQSHGRTKMKKYKIPEISKESEEHYSKARERLSLLKSRWTGKDEAYIDFIHWNPKDFGCPYLAIDMVSQKVGKIVPALHIEYGKDNLYRIAKNLVDYTNGYPIAFVKEETKSIDEVFAIMQDFEQNWKNQAEWKDYLD